MKRVACEPPAGSIGAEGLGHFGGVKGSADTEANSVPFDRDAAGQRVLLYATDG
jgi:hypothetical protein